MIVKWEWRKNPLRVLDCKVDKCKELTADAPIITDSLSVEEKAHYETVKKYLTLFNVKYKEDPRLVRGLIIIQVQFMRLWQIN